MGEKSFDKLMKRMNKDSYPYSSKQSVKQKPKNQSNIRNPDEIGDLLKKHAEWHKKSLVEKLDHYEKNIEGNSEQHNYLIEGGFRNPILNVLPRYMEIEKLDYKNIELKIILQEVYYTKGLNGKIILAERLSLYESDYNKLLRNYPCIREVISGIKKKGIKVVYDKKDMIIRSKSA